MNKGYRSWEISRLPRSNRLAPNHKARGERSAPLTREYIPRHCQWLLLMMVTDDPVRSNRSYNNIVLYLGNVTIVVYT